MARKRVAKAAAVADEEETSVVSVVAESEGAGPAKRNKVEKEEMKDEVKEDVDPRPAKEVITAIKEQARIAVASLLKFIADKESKSLFPEADHGVDVLVTYKKPAEVNTRLIRKRIILPNPSMSATSAMVCLIMPDLDRSKAGRTDPDVEKQAREWADSIEAEHGLLVGTHVAKIITKRQLEREYKTFKQKRDLATAYDLFLVEKTVHKTVRAHLGKEFIRAHKMPLDFDYSQPLGETIKKAAATSIFDVSAHRVRVTVRAGHLGQPYANLIENVEHVISEILSCCPGGLLNVRSFFVQQASSTPSLPIYMDNGSANAVVLPKAPKKRLVDQEIRGDLSTLPEGLQVGVTKSGRVRVFKDTTGESVLYPTNKDEWQMQDDLKVIDAEKVANARKNKKKRVEKSVRRAEKRSGVKKEESDFKAIVKIAKKARKMTKTQTSKVTTKRAVPMKNLKSKTAKA